MKRILSVFIFGLILIAGSCQKEVRVEKSKFKLVNRVFMLGDEKFTGVAYENYTDGTLKSEWTLLNGIEHGPGNTYYPNGQVDEKILWKDGEKDGPYEKYYDDGQLEVKAQYAFNEKDGYFETFYKSGKPWRKGYYDNGKLEGTVEEYYENGKSKNLFNLE